jgi:hypothetical protein
VGSWTSGGVDGWWAWTRRRPPGARRDAAAVVDATDNGTVGGRRWSNRRPDGPAEPLIGPRLRALGDAARRSPGKISGTGCGQPLAGRPAGLLASRRSSALPLWSAQAVGRRRPRRVRRSLPSATIAPDRDISGQPMYTACGRACGRVPGQGAAAPSDPERRPSAPPPGPARSTSGPDRRVRHERVTG